MFFPLMLAAVGRYKRLMAAGVNRRVIKTGEDVKTQRSDEAGGRGRGGRGRADGDGLTRAGGRGRGDVLGEPEERRRGTSGRSR